MDERDRNIGPMSGNFVKDEDVDYSNIASIEGVAEGGELSIRLLMAGTEVVLIEAYKRKGMIDPWHTHEDHESIAYLLSGRMRLQIGDEEFVAAPGDVWRHPKGVPHLSEALEDCIQLEVKAPPRKTWQTDKEAAS